MLLISKQQYHVMQSLYDTKGEMSPHIERKVNSDISKLKALRESSCLLRIWGYATPAVLFQTLNGSVKYGSPDWSLYAWYQTTTDSDIHVHIPNLWLL